MALAVTAAVSAGELRVGFTPSSLAEQVARLTTDGVNYTVRNTNNIVIGTFPVSTVAAISVTGISSRDRFEIPASSPQPVSSPLAVASTVDTTLIAKAVVAGGSVRIASPSVTLAADVSSTLGQLYAGSVTVVGPVSVAAASEAIRFESTVSGAEGSRLTVDSGGDSTILGGLTGGIRLVQRGGGILALESAATHTDGTLVEAGTVVAGRAGALGTGTVQVAAGGRVSLDAGAARTPLDEFGLAATGRWDVGAGGIQVAAGGYDEQAVRSALVAGRDGGTWNGAAGIVSSAAGGEPGRAVGYAVDGDGGLSIAYAAFGDANLDGRVSQSDINRLVASGKFGHGSADPGWSDGDFNYSGSVTQADINMLVQGGLFGSGSYLPVTETTVSFTEDWEGESTARLPGSEWVLQTGSWGSIAQRDVRNAGRKIAVAAGETSRLMRPVDLAGSDHVVLQGWFSDSAGANQSMLGLASFPGMPDAALVRMGASGKGTYRIEYFDPVANTLVELDTGLALEPGWHFMRLDVVRRQSDPQVWDATWRGWNTARTSEVQRAFSWRFDPAKVNWVSLGAATATPGPVAWDEIEVGSLGDVGPAPALPVAPPVVRASASSAIPGWDPAKLVDADDGSVYSSNGHGPNAAVTEWAAIDLGATFSVTSIAVTPRSGGWCFPVDYEIQYSTDMTSWNTVPGQVHVGQERPDGLVTHVFGAPIQARGLRVYATRLSPDGSGNHYLQLARLEVPRFKLDTQPWVTPAELRDKSLNSTGIFSNAHLNSDVAPTPRFLAENPEYLANHPFDGVTVPLMIDGEYLRSQGVFSGPHGFQWIGMSSLPIPWSAVAESVAYLKQVQWGDVTDNFLWVGVQNVTNGTWEDGDRPYWVDPASQADWNVVVANAAVAARAAREGGLKGFIIDTEQYTLYPSAGNPEYPFGLGTAATWRERGRQWIEAVQAEFPDIELQFFFSWGDEYVAWPNYHNLVPFMDGILAGIRDPARIIHAWESSFWWGQARAIPPGSGSFTLYDADRTPYIGARDSIRNVWRTYSDNPTKYDDFVDVGMAAWFDSDPWNLWPGWPSGYLNESVHWGRSTWPAMPWSNVANTLAYVDKYVWTWSSNTHYSATFDQLNPFMASVANQTFNTGRERVVSFTEDFSTDPLKRGWYFNFSFMDIGRRPAPDDGPPQLVQTTDAVAYAWKETDGAVTVRGNWTRGEFGEIEGLLAPQQRRYVRPVEPLTRSDDIRLEIDFAVDSFGSDPANPILVGLFHSEAPVDRQGLALRIASAADVSLAVAGDGTPWSLPIAPTKPLVAGRGYRAVVEYVAATRSLGVTLRERPGGVVIATASATLPTTTGPFVLDEAGVAQREAAFAATADTAYRFRLEGFSLGSLSNEPPGGVTGFATSDVVTAGSPVGQAADVMLAVPTGAATSLPLQLAFAAYGSDDSVSVARPRRRIAPAVPAAGSPAAR